MDTSSLISETLKFLDLFEKKIVPVYKIIVFIKKLYKEVKSNKSYLILYSVVLGHAKGQNAE